jgi:multicomponent Na+:H+ antiporter subunit D
MVLGLGLFTVAGVAGAIFYMAHNIVAKTNTFLSAGMVNQLRGSFELKELGGLYNSKPLVAILFIIPAMGLAGIPPFSGFVGKLYLIYAGFETEKYLITAIAVVVSLLTLFSMIKIWNEVFWKANPSGEKKETGRVPLSMYIPVGILAAITILMGIFGGYFIEISKTAAEQLLNPEGYIDKVLYNK